MHSCGSWNSGLKVLEHAHTGAMGSLNGSKWAYAEICVLSSLFQHQRKKSDGTLYRRGLLPWLMTVECEESCVRPCLNMAIHGRLGSKGCNSSLKVDTSNKKQQGSKINKEVGLAIMKCRDNAGQWRFRHDYLKACSKCFAGSSN